MRTRRHLLFSEVQRIAEHFNLPSKGMAIDEELKALLLFLHSQGVVLWYDEPSLRELVVLDLQWVIDAATCFVRDFEETYAAAHGDHAASDHAVPNGEHTADGDRAGTHARLWEIDAQAILQEPRRWRELTKGRAILGRPLLALMWQRREFAPHVSALVDILSRLSLLVPLPALCGGTSISSRNAQAAYALRGDHAPVRNDAGEETYLVPALLRHHSSAPPSNWPTHGGGHRGWRVGVGGASILLRFSLDAQRSSPPKLTYVVAEGAALAHGSGVAGVGFLSREVFLRLCASALSSTRVDVGDEPPLLFRDQAWVGVRVGVGLAVGAGAGAGDMA